MVKHQLQLPSVSSEAWARLEESPLARDRAEVKLQSSVILQPDPETSWSLINSCSEPLILQQLLFALLSHAAGAGHHRCSAVQMSSLKLPPPPPLPRDVVSSLGLGSASSTATQSRGADGTRGFCSD